MADVTPAPAQEPANPTPAPQAPVAEAEPQGTPPTSPQLKRVNRLAQVREVVAKRAAAEEPAKEAPATPPAANDDKEKVETKPDTKPAEPDPQDKKAEAAKAEAGKAKAWADVMERENKARKEREEAKREREQIAKDRAALEAERREATEARELLAKDPVAYAAKYGGKDFGKRLVDYTLDEKARFADQQAAKLAEIDTKLEQLTRMTQEKETQALINNHISSHESHWKADKEAAVLTAWYAEDEVRPTIQRIAEHYASERKELLTPQELASNLRNELKVRLERLAKTESGQEFLKQFITGTPAPAKTRPPAEAPKTLSKDLTTQGTPPGEGRLRKFSDKDRADLLRQVLQRRQG